MESKVDDICFKTAIAGANPATAVFISTACAGS